MTNDKEYYGFIYLTTNKVNGMKYVGQKTYDKRGNWKTYLGSGVYLKRAISKYGKDNFSRQILEYQMVTNIYRFQLYFYYQQYYT